MTNGEKFKTAEEREKAFEEFCGTGRCDVCKLHKDTLVQCAFVWIDLEAEEEKPMPCPFYGGDSIDIFETAFGRSEEPYQFAVKCHLCGALVSAEDEGAAIAAWNRRTK